MRLASPALLALALAGAACHTPEPGSADLAGGDEFIAPAPVHFIEDELELALATAKRDNKLLFVDAWAPWCHTCLSMRDEVLGRPELSPFARDYVFLAIDTDRPSAASFLERYRLRAWPTFFVIEPSTRAVLGMHGGALSLAELSSLLTRARASQLSDLEPGQAALVQAHAAFGERRLLDAARLYEDAATELPDDRRAEALLGAIRSLYEAKAHARCSEVGVAHAEAVSGAAAPSDFLFYLKECASALEAGPERDAALGLVKRRLERLVSAPPAGATVDDRADTMGLYAELLKDSGDAAGARALEERRLALLEAAAAAAVTNEQAQTYDYARMNALLALGRGEQAVSLFKQRIEQLPKSYEAHARLGSTLLTLGRNAEALASLSKAIELSYGPRRLRYLAQRAKAQQALGDRPGAITTLEEEVLGWRQLPASQQDEAKLEDARKRLEEARAPAPVAPPAK